MRRIKTPQSILAAVASAALALTIVGLPTGAHASRTAEYKRAAEPKSAPAFHKDNLRNPAAIKQNALRKKAIGKLIDGTANIQRINGNRVVKLKGAYVDLAPEQKDQILTFLVGFGDQVDPALGGDPGPGNGQIPRPDRNWDGSATDDNSTYWVQNFDRAHFLNMFFGEHNSMADYYHHLSNSRFTVTGDVSDWVTVPYNEARYGSNEQSDADGYWPFVQDAGNSWYDAQKTAGMSDAQIKDYLAQFDVWDRYDYDGDGNFDEPDGYIDHFQAVHAGEGEEAGGGAQGTDAIWSHRWFAFQNLRGSQGPTGNPYGGTEIGDTGYWIGDYTTEPENGGLGVFSHEFGHDLGLPDMYDTQGGDNGTGFWTIMSAGSWMSGDHANNIGTRPDYMGAWEKIFLGWENFKVVDYGDDTLVKLGPANKNGQNPQAIVVVLPDKTTETVYNTPYSGDFEWWGGSADNLNTTLTRSIDLTGATSASVSAKAWYNLETDYDYAYAEVSTDGGTTWDQVGDALNGPSGDWVDVSWDLSAYAGQQVDFRLREATDGGLHYEGAFFDDFAITVDGSTVFTDDVESGDNGWTADGFERMGGTTSVTTPQYYIAENRTYLGYDRGLKSGPYNFGFTDTRPDWVEKFPYQNGLLVWYVDYAYDDNNTIAHPGGGLALPVDARPTPVTFPSGVLLGNRRQPFDATFGLAPTDEVTFHRLGVGVTVPSSPAIPTFDDSDPNAYYSALNPLSSVQVAGTGTSLTVVLVKNPQDKTMHVQVAFE